MSKRLRGPEVRKSSARRARPPRGRRAHSAIRHSANRSTDQPDHPPAHHSSLPREMNTSDAIPPGQDGGNADTYAKVMESLTRIALAGFGGAIAGLSISRRRAAGAPALARVDAAVSGGGKRRRRGGSSDSSRRRNQQGGTSASAPYVDQDLPSTWAFACLTFASITESTRLLSPTTLVSDLLQSTSSLPDGRDTGNDDEEASVDMPWVSHMPKVDLPAFSSKISVVDVRSISDYVIGGSIAGAVFKGSSVQTSAGVRWAKRAGGNTTAGITAAATRTSFMAGLIPGAALGFLAGILQVGAGHLEQMLLEEDTAADIPVEASAAREED